MKTPESRGPDTGSDEAITGADSQVTEPRTSADLLAERLEEYRYLSSEEAVDRLKSDIADYVIVFKDHINRSKIDLNYTDDESDVAWLEKAFNDWMADMAALVDAVREIKEWDEELNTANTRPEAISKGSRGTIAPLAPAEVALAKRVQTLKN